MANYETLKSAIQQVVKTNGNNEITGALLQQSLLAMINSLGSGYQFMGVARPTTNPGTPDSKQFYITTTVGTYSNFSGLIVSRSELALFYNDATEWRKQSVPLYGGLTSGGKYILPNTEIKPVNDFIKELYITGLGNGDYYIRNFTIQTTTGDLIIAIGQTSYIAGVILPISNISNGEIVEFSGGTLTVRVVFQNIEKLTTGYILDNTTDYVINKNIVGNVYYSPSIAANLASAQIANIEPNIPYIYDDGIQFISNDQDKHINSFIRSLYIQGLDAGVDYMLRNFGLHSTEGIVFHLAKSSGAILNWNNIQPNESIQTYTAGGVTVTLQLKNVSKLTSFLISGNTDTTKYAINKLYCCNNAYSPSIATMPIPPMVKDIADIKPFLNIDTEGMNGYMKSDGTIVPGGSTLWGKKTNKIDCQPGQIFMYKGYGQYSAVSVLFYNGNTITGNEKYQSPDDYTEIVIPNNVDGVVFASYKENVQSSDAVVLSVIMKLPASLPYLEKKINEITTTGKLTGKSVSFNGDSICYGAGYVGGYGKIIATRNNMTYQNIGIAGGTITGDLAYYVGWVNNGTYYYTRKMHPVPETDLAYTGHGTDAPSGTTKTITAYDSANNTITIDGVLYSYDATQSKMRHWISRTITNMDSAADYAILEGGVNDMWNAAAMGQISQGYNAQLDDKTFYGATESMLKQLLLRFAGKKIGFIIVHGVAESWHNSNSTYRNAIIECCEKWGVPYLDLNKECPPFGLWTSQASTMYSLTQAYTNNADGTHLNEQGYLKYYCDKIQSWMETL